MTSMIDNSILETISRINNNPFDEINKLKIEILEKIILYLVIDFLIQKNQLYLMPSMTL